MGQRIPAGSVVCSIARNTDLEISAHTGHKYGITKFKHRKDKKEVMH